jgi:hypothetical protein
MRKNDVTHVPLVCTIECYPMINSNVEPNQVYCFKKANYDEINKHLSEIYFAEPTRNHWNVNESLEWF